MADTGGGARPTAVKVLLHGLRTTPESTDATPA